MMTIPEGYKIHVVAPDEELLETMEVGGYNFDKSMARDAFADALSEVVRLHVEFGTVRGIPPGFGK